MSNKSNHLSNLNVLQAPDFPQAENGIIDVSLLDGVILIEIHAYTAINVGDKIEVIFNEYISKDYYITDIDEYIIYIKYPDKYLPNGSYSVYYTATDNAGNINRSTATQIKIINSIVQQLPAPAFPSAVNDVLYYNSFAYDQGTIIRAAYPGITAGDKIIFFWKGSNEEGYTVGQATYRSHLIKVSIDNAADGYIQDIIPSKNIKLLGDNAICTGYYNLIRNNGGTQIISENKEVSTSWSDITQLQLVATTGAPVRDLKTTLT
ncbi:hypothetical protein HED50_14375 [Ochrobactrum oryzae]|nr:hypothetical protein [Brucella oryzae]